MAKFNTRSFGTKTVNLAGGKAYSMNAELELASLALTSFNENKFYESDSDQNKRLISLVEKVDKEFVGNLALYARHEFNLRSITHVLAAELARLHKGQKDIIKKIISRVDDMTEIVSYYGNKYGKPIPNSIKKAIRERLPDFSAYELGKYKSGRSDVKLVDLFNLVHPRPKNKEQERVWKDLLEGKLVSDTWEVALSTAKNNEERTTAWERLILEDKLGYMAMIRNLRNFGKYKISSEAKGKVCAVIQSEERIKKSKQLPFRFYSAYQNAEDPDYKDAISYAMDTAVQNVPEFSGKTAVLIDVSGSMNSPLSSKSDVKYVDIARLFGCAFFKANKCDVFAFDSNVYKYTFSTRTPLIDLISNVRATGGSTDLWKCFAAFMQNNEDFDRAIILSDMQAWDSGYDNESVKKWYDQWAKKIGKRPLVYSIDLAGYGTHQFPEKEIMFVSGWSEKIFDLIKFSEIDKNSLINTIKGYKLG